MFKGSLCFGLPLTVAIGLGASVGAAGAFDRAHETALPQVNASIEVAAPFATAEPASLQISLRNEKKLTLQLLSVTTGQNGTTWNGIVEDTGESTMLMRWNDGRLGGVLGYKGEVYAITSEDGQLRAAVERQPKSVRDHAVTSPQHTADATRRHARGGNASAATIQNMTTFSDAERLALEAKQITIDLMVVYTRSAASHYVMPMEDLIARAVEETNQSFRNSGLANIRLRLVHSQLIKYDETTGEYFEHLYRMVDGVGTFKEIHRQRDEKRADIVGMIVDDPSGCGLSTRVAPDPEEAYFVVHHSCAAITLSLAHEIGHILGARHDRDSDETGTPFPYGHGHVNGTKWRDIMSYKESCDGCRRIPYWSNPRITYRGEPTGTDQDDNARVILQQAERVASFR